MLAAGMLGLLRLTGAPLELVSDQLRTHQPDSEAEATAPTETSAAPKARRRWDRGGGNAAVQWERPRRPSAVGPHDGLDP